MFIYNYNLSDFLNTNKINLTLFLKKIKETSGIPEASFIEREDIVKIFYITELTAGEKTALDTLVSNYTYEPFPRLSKPVIFDAFVSNDYFIKGNYKSIKSAFDAGHKSVFVKSTNIPYNETGDILIPCEGSIFGENLGNVIIDFGGGPNSIYTNSYTNSNIGSISVINGSKIVTGSGGTTFTDLQSQIGVTGCPHVSILIGTQVFNIASIETNTSLTLEDIYQGNTKSFDYYYISVNSKNISIQNISIQNSSKPGIILQNTNNSKIDNVNLINCGSDSNLVIINCIKTYINNIRSDKNILGGDGIMVSDSIDLRLGFCSFHNNTGSGIKILGNSLTKNINIESCIFENNYKNGIQIGSGVTGTNQCNFISIVETKINNNTENGVIIYNDDNGLSGSHGHILSNSEISNNGLDGILNDGISCRFSGLNVNNQIGRGIVIKNKDCIFEGNLVYSNGSDGFFLDGNKANHNNICDNIFKENLGNGVVFNGDLSSVIFSSNCVNGNTGNGLEMISQTILDKINLNGNNIENNGGNGISISAGTTGVHCILTGNLIENNSGTGIMLENISKSLVNSNISLNNIVSDVITETNCVNNVIVNNITV